MEEMKKSLLQQERAAYLPKLPKGLQGVVKVKEGEPTQSVGNQEEIKALFPNTYGMPLVEFVPGDEAVSKKMNVGVILSGGQAPGGHNVITGLFDAIKKLNPENRLYGFILGPGGLVDHNYMEITAEIADEYRNTGGFDMIGSGRTKLEKEDQFEKGLEIIYPPSQKDQVQVFGFFRNTVGNGPPGQRTQADGILNCLHWHRCRGNLTSRRVPGREKSRWTQAKNVSSCWQTNRRSLGSTREV